MAFSGNHEHTLDAKNRLTVPARFRSALGTAVALTKGFERCLQLYPQATYEDMTRQALAGLNPFSPEARELRRHFFGNAETTELDTAGRIKLSADQMTYAGIGKDVVVVGAMDCLEIWDRATWREHSSGLIGRAAEHIANVGHPG